MKPTEKQLVIGRRSALKMLGLSSAAMLAAGFSDINAAETAAEMKPKAKPLLTSGNSSVSFTTGTDRKHMIAEVIKPFDKEIRSGLKGKQLIIKVNMVVTNNPLCAPHVDALDALLDYLKPIYKGQIIIGESSSNFDSNPGFKNYGFDALANKYNVKFVNLNGTTGTPAYVLDRNLHMDKIQLIETLVNPNNYIISLSRLKTHNTVIMTGGVKNMAMGAPLMLEASGSNRAISYKRNMHSGGPRWLHYNIFAIFPLIRPDFTIIDGIEGMEGNGPISGTPTDHRIALAGEDTVAVDSLCCKMMGIPLSDVGYLTYLDAAGYGTIDYNKIDIIGSAKPDDHILKYKLPSNAAYQLEWKDPLNLPSQMPGGQQRPPQQPGQQPGQPPAQPR